MKEITRHSQSRVYKRRELATLLGFEPQVMSKIVITISGDDVTVTQDDTTETGK